MTSLQNRWLQILIVKNKIWIQMLVMGKFLWCLAHSLSSGVEGKFQDYPGEMHSNYIVLFLHSLIHHIPNTHIVYRSCAIIKHLLWTCVWSSIFQKLKSCGVFLTHILNRAHEKPEINTHTHTHAAFNILSGLRLAIFIFVSVWAWVCTCFLLDVFQLFLWVWEKEYQEYFEVTFLNLT